MSENELVEGILNNQETAFKELVHLYQKQVISCCYGFTGNYPDAQDVAQDVFIEVYESIGSFRREAKLSTWIYRIAVNKSINYKKQMSRRQWVKSIESFFGKENNESLTVKAHKSDEANCNIEGEERKTILHIAIDKLPENQRIAFTLSKFDELSYQQIAEVMKTSLPSVESLLHRAKMNLQKNLVHYYK
ncbi:MAG: sigma-70 family RNA polymerase sigma factor [Bacteroidetes bacterium]|nr:sigma-70 family RNA polymerase sigma factor [Bacteroidota bacterium]